MAGMQVGLLNLTFKKYFFMALYLLDAGGAGLYFILVGLFIFFIVLAILMEAGIMMLMKYNSSLKKTFIDSLIINIASLAVGFALLQFFEQLGYYTLVTLAILYGITVIVETVILKLLNKQHTLWKTVQVSIVMNLITYIILYLITGD